MKNKIENAIRKYLEGNNRKILVDGKLETFPLNTSIEYISPITCSSYTCNSTNEAQEWENEYQQWLANNKHTSFTGDIVLKIGNMKLKTTSFDFHFVEADDVKISIDDMICETHQDNSF